MADCLWREASSTLIGSLASIACGVSCAKDAIDAINATDAMDATDACAEIRFTRHERRKGRLWELRLMVGDSDPSFQG